MSVSKQQAIKANYIATAFNTDKTIMNRSTNLNKSCEEARLFGEQVFINDTETVQRYVTLGYYSLLFPLSLSLTLFVLFLIMKFKHLRDTTFILALQVVILDLVLSLTLTPVVISSTVSGRWVLGSGMCKAIGAETEIIFLLRNWFMFVFVFDRFCNVFMPFRYNRKCKRAILTLLFFILVFTASCTLLSSIMGCHGFNRTLWVCIASAQIEFCPNFLFCNAYIIAINAIIGQMIGSFIPLIMYIVLFIKAKKVRNQLTPAGNVQVDGEQRKRDKRANLTFFTMFLVLFVLKIPSLVAYVLTKVLLPTLGVRPSEWLLLVSFSLQELYSLLPITDSIIVLRNPEMRRAINMLKNRITNRDIN